MTKNLQQFVVTQKKFLVYMLMHLVAVVGLVYFWDPIYLIGTLFFTSIITASTEILFHRKYSHNSFSCRPSVEIGLNIISIFSLYEPINFSLIHRGHHKFSDTEKDAERLGTSDLKSWFGYLDNPNLLDTAFYKTLTASAHELMKQPIPYFFGRFNLLLYVFTIILVSIIDYKFAFYCLFLSSILTQYNFSCITILCHKYGYRNFNTKDKSKNNPWCFWLLGGQWHNNHHHRPWSYTTNLKGEFDLIGWIIKNILATEVRTDKEKPL